MSAWRGIRTPFSGAYLSRSGHDGGRWEQRKYLENIPIFSIRKIRSPRYLQDLGKIVELSRRRRRRGLVGPAAPPHRLLQKRAGRGGALYRPLTLEEHVGERGGPGGAVDPAGGGRRLADLHLPAAQRPQELLHAQILVPVDVEDVEYDVDHVVRQEHPAHLLAIESTLRS